jgi:hypothetical protein
MPRGEARKCMAATRHSFTEGGLLLRRIPLSCDKLRILCVGAQVALRDN